MLTVEKAEEIVKKNKTKSSIMRALSGYNPRNEQHEYHKRLFNIKVDNPDGTMIRIYKTFSGDIRVQKWTPCEIHYSGIPTFKPSGVCSLF